MHIEHPFLAATQKFVLRVVLITTAALLVSIPVTGQTGPTDGMTPSGLTAGAPTGTYGLSGFDNVNLYNGQLNVALPLLGLGGRGEAQSQMTLKLETSHWLIEKDSSDGLEYYYPNPNSWEGIRPGYGPGVLQARVGRVQMVQSHTAQTLTRLTFTTGDGTEYQLIDTEHGGAPWSTGTRPRGRTFVSHEGAFITFISNNDIVDEIEPVYSDGLDGYLYFPDGTRYEIEDGLVKKIRDRNGNLIFFLYDSFKRVTTITDSLNRQVTVTYADLVSTFYDQISYKGFGGAQRTIKIWHTSLGSALRSGYSTQTYQQLFSGTDQTVYNPNNVVSAVELPDGRQYQFRYNPYGELARLVLPTGGAIEYDYVEKGDGITVTQRRLSQRRIYADGTNLETKQVYTANYSGTTTTAVEQRDANNILLAKSLHYFHSDPISSINNAYNSAVSYSHWQEGREFKTESLAADGSTVLRRSESTWEQGATVTSWLASHDAANNPRVNQTVSTLVDTNQVSKQTFAFDNYNNTTDVSEYNFGSGTAGTQVRRTHTDFLTTNPVNGVNYTATANNLYFYRLPKQISVFEGEIERARTSFEYDNYATDTNHAGLLDRLNISGLDAAFTTSYVTRANLTATTRYLLNSGGSVIGSISTYAQRDIAGNTFKAIDGRGYPTYFYFDDCFGGPNGNAQLNSAPLELSSAGKSSFAMLTKVTNALNQSAFAQYDYFLGRAVEGEDMNGVIASGYFDDLLDRPTKVIRDYNDLSGKSQILFNYDDTNRIMTTRSDFAAFNDQMLRKDSLYDGLGRTTETRAYENATQYITVKTVPFVVLQDPDNNAWLAASQTSNPYRSGSLELTTTFTDSLGRVTKVRTPDNAITRTSYSGNTVTVTDPAGKARKSVSDALGRMSSVYEDPSGMNYQTSYTYDVLDNLVTVSQGVQTRSFGYDSLSRVTSATNPESGTSSYTYDNNGNIATKTDARNIVTTMTHDALNRNTLVDYSDATPDVYRQYDQAVYGKGRINQIWQSGNTTSMTVIDEYDAQGRVRVQRQKFETNGVWSASYQTSATYNVAGAVTTMTYPSGHAVTYNYDSAGRLGDKDANNLAFTGNLGDGTTRTYARGISYSAFGALTQEQFGTNTAVYNKRHYNIRGQLYDLRMSTLSLAQNEFDWNRGALVLYYGGAGWGQSSTTNNGNVVSLHHWVPANDAITDYTYTQQNYAYDTLNRLSSVGEVHGGTWGQSSTDFVQAYVYDRYGNRTIDQTSTSGTNIPKPNFGVDTATNRLTAPSGYTMSYDAVGNLINDTYTGQGTRTFDAENRMTGAQTSSSASYVYAGDGQRVRRNVDGLETWQIYGIGGELLAEYAASGSASSPQKEYGYRNGELLITAEPSTRVNVALAANGGTAVGSSALSGYAASKANDGDRQGGDPKFWADSSPGTFPDWLEIDFNGAKTISEIDVVTLQDNLSNPPEPTLTQTFSSYGATAFDVQYWNGSAWVTISGGSVTGNNKVWRQFTFAPVSTTKIRVVVNAVQDNNYSRVVELEAWTASDTATSANIHWLVTDQLGTPRMVFDQTGSLANVSRHDYLPFGEDMPANFRTGIPGYGTGDGVRQKFAGYENDLETGLNFAQARYQSPTQGRFTSPDPFGPSMRPTDPQSLNRYSYVGNNPINAIDPSGLATINNPGAGSLPGAAGALGRAKPGECPPTESTESPFITTYTYSAPPPVVEALAIASAVLNGVAGAVVQQQPIPQPAPAPTPSKGDPNNKCDSRIHGTEMNREMTAIAKKVGGRLDKDKYGNILGTISGLEKVQTKHVVKRFQAAGFVEFYSYNSEHPGINLQRPEPNDTVWYHVTIEPGKRVGMASPPGRITIHCDNAANHTLHHFVQDYLRWPWPFK